MSMQNVLAFGQAVSADQQLQTELEAAIGGVGGEQAFAKTAEFATAKGYDVTAGEVEQGYRALEKAEGGQGELNDAELEIVSGGKASAESNLGKVGKEFDGVGDASKWKNLFTSSAPWKKLFGI